MSLNSCKGLIKLLYIPPVLSIVLLFSGCSDDEPNKQQAMRDPDREKAALYNEYKEFKDMILKKE